MVSEEPVIRVRRRPNLDIVLSPTGLEKYAAKRARIDKLLEDGRIAEREERERQLREF